MGSTGRGEESGHDDGHVAPAGPRPDAPRPTLDSAVRLRRADRAFFLRLAGAIRQHERALQRLKR
ncbi:MAG: hypothetical protein ACLQRH_06900 [Acidimicrobiales bacterium]